MSSLKLQNQLTNEKKMSLKSFHIIGMIAQGAYSEVYEAIQLRNNRKVAIKKVYKESITQQNKHAEIYMERYIQKQYSSKNPRSFQDKDFLYFVNEYCPYGDLGILLMELQQQYKKSQAKDVEKLMKIYIKQIAEAIIFLHKQGIAHLDIKPKNLVVDNNYNLKLIDFATCCFFEESKMPQELQEQLKKYQQQMLRSMKKLESQCTQMRSNFVGTPEYVSPEMLNYSRASKEADLWALGCIIYEFFCGKQPFTDISENAIFNNILNLNYNLDINIPDYTKDIIKQLLKLNPIERLGHQDSQELLQHNFFQDINDYQPYYSQLPIPNECVGFYQELLAKQSMQSILWGLSTIPCIKQKQEQFLNQRRDRLKTIMEELEEAITPTPASVHFKSTNIHTTPSRVSEQAPIKAITPSSDVDSIQNSVFKHFDKSVGFIQLNTNRWFCIPQIAILFGYLKPPCLLIDFIKGEKRYLPIDDSLKITFDGVYYVKNLQQILQKILQSANFFYKFRDAEARPINWIQVVRSIKKEYLNK